MLPRFLLPFAFKQQEMSFSLRRCGTNRRENCFRKIKATWLSLSPFFFLSSLVLLRVTQGFDQGECFFFNSICFSFSSDNKPLMSKGTFASSNLVCPAAYILMKYPLINMQRCLILFLMNWTGCVWENETAACFLAEIWMKRSMPLTSWYKATASSCLA